MSDRTSGNWLPYDLDGQIHDCKQTGTKKVETRALTFESIDARAKKIRINRYRPTEMSQLPKVKYGKNGTNSDIRLEVYTTDNHYGT